MADRSIIFSGPMARAILVGTKTQTRRVIKSGNGAASIYAGERDGLWVVERFGDPASAMIRCPYHVGTRLWVREQLRGDGQPGNRRVGITRYGVDGEMVLPCCTCGNVACNCTSGPAALVDCCWEWKRPILNAMFMPRWASRITLEVTDVRVQRVQEISEEDARAEGAKFFDGRPINHHGWRHDECDLYETARESFTALWQAINAKRGFPWSSNPWVWAITFRSIDDTSRAHGGNQGRDEAVVDKDAICD